MENGSNGAVGEELENGGCFLEIYCSEIYVCSPYTGKFEKWDPCTMGTWVNSFWEISPELNI